jgi:hypothetical protein
MSTRYLAAYLVAISIVFTSPLFAQGPLVLMGIDAEDGGVGGHGPISVYVNVVNSVYNSATNGGTGILVIGGGKTSTDDVTRFWNAIASGTGRSVTYVNGATAITAVSFSGFRMIAVVSDVVNTPSGGLTNAENNALTPKAPAVAAFVNGGGGVLGFSSVQLTTPYGYLGNIGTFTFGDVGNQDNITPTAAGLAIGITDALDICCWHDSYITFPAFLNVLATYPGVTGNPAAAIGGQQVVVGEAITLSPLLATNNVGTTHTVTATVQNTNGVPIQGRSVTIRVKSGPHAGQSATGNTNASGQFAFTYTGTIAGTDSLIGRMINSNGQPDSSNVVRKIWVSSDIVAPSCNVTAIIPGPPKQVQITVQDAQSGLASISVVTALNCNVSIPSFTVGTTSPVVVTATKINQSAGSTVILRATDVAGNSASCDPVYTTLSAEVPTTYQLKENFPNPFNPTTRIDFSIAKSEDMRNVSIKVYDLLGREVRTLINEPMQAGVYSVEWDGKNEAGAAVTSGVYLYRMVAGDFVSTRRMTLMK